MEGENWWDKICEIKQKVA